jgi:hypothetical protein
MMIDLRDDIVADKRITNSLQDSDKSNRLLVFQKLLDEKMVEDVDNHLELFNNYHDNYDFKAHLTKCIDKMVSEKLREMI